MKHQNKKSLNVNDKKEINYLNDIRQFLLLINLTIEYY